MSRSHEREVSRLRVYDRSGTLLEADAQVLVRTTRGWETGVVAGFDDAGNVAVRIGGVGARRRRVWAFPVDVETTKQLSLFDVGGGV